MATFKKKGGATSRVQLYYIARQFPGRATYGKDFGDAGLIIKLLDRGNDEKLLRLESIKKYDGKERYECGKCGLPFISMAFRDAHGRRRHGSSGASPRVKEMDELTPEQKRRLVAESGQYETQPSDFNTPDPDDAAISADERMMQEMAPIPWDKTAASRR